MNGPSERMGGCAIEGSAPKRAGAAFDQLETDLQLMAHSLAWLRDCRGRGQSERVVSFKPVERTTIGAEASAGGESLACAPARVRLTRPNKLAPVKLASLSLARASESRK